MEVRERRDMVRAGLTRRRVKGQVRWVPGIVECNKTSWTLAAPFVLLHSIAGRQAQIYECDENLQDSRMRRPGCTCRD
jgi:hypothetical protein